MSESVSVRGDDNLVVDPQDYLSSTQVAKVLGVTPRRVQAMVSDGQIAYVELSLPGIRRPVRLFGRDHVEDVRQGRERVIEARRNLRALAHE